MSDSGPGATGRGFGGRLTTGAVVFMVALGARASLLAATPPPPATAAGASAGAHQGQGQRRAFRNPDDDDSRNKITRWKFIRIVDRRVTDLRGSDPDQIARARFDRALRGLSPDDPAAAQSVFAYFTFAEIVELSKQPGVITLEEALALAEARRQMIRTAMEDAWRATGDPNLRFGMLDSGNKESGIHSDVDQTVFVWDTRTGEHASAERINDVIRHFNVAYHSRWGHDPERMGIESLNGDEFYPDWRLTSSVAEHVHRAVEVVDVKRQNPEAYGSAGQLRSQAEGRGYEAVQEFGARLQELEAQQIDLFVLWLGAGAPGGPAWLTGDGEVDWEGNEEARLDYESALLDGGWESYDDFLAELEELKRLSPWTEVGLENGEVRARTDVDPREKILRIEPEQARRFAFDGAYDNWYMFQHHPENAGKYLTRGVAESVGLEAAEGSRRVVPYDYATHYGNGDHETNREFVERTYGDVVREAEIARRERGEPLEGSPLDIHGDLTFEKITRALDTAARFRLAHKGTPNPATGEPYTPTEIWEAYLPTHWPVNGAGDPIYPEQTRLEAAERAFRAEAREIMIENMLLTVVEPARLLGRDPELRSIVAEMRRGPLRDAQGNLETLAADIQLQLLNGFRDVMTLDHARELLEADPQQQIDRALNRQRDVVDRLFEVLGNEFPDQGDEMRQLFLHLAREAAARRLAAEEPPKGLDRLRTLRDTLTARLQDVARIPDTLRRRWEAGEFDREVVARRLMSGLRERLGGTLGEFLSTLGYRVNISTLIPEGEESSRVLPIEIEGFSGRQMMDNLVSVGNLDSALAVAQAWQDCGGSSSPDAARDCAGSALAWEMIQGLPGGSELLSLWGLATRGEVKPAFMNGAAMFIPGVGEAYIAVSIATTAVRLIGNALMDELNDSTLDAIYQGYWSEDPLFGLVRRDRGESPYTSLLAPVEVRVIPYPFTDEDGSVVLAEDGKYRRAYAIAPFPGDELVAAGLYESREMTEWGREHDLLGGGKDWDREYESLMSFVRDAQTRPDMQRTAYRRLFEAKRASVYYQYDEPVNAFLQEHYGLDLDELLTRTGYQDMLAPFFRAVVDRWSKNTGEFADLPDYLRGVDPEGNAGNLMTLAPRGAIELRRELQDRLGYRMMGDFLRGFQQLRNRPDSIERMMRANLEAQYADHLKLQVNQALVVLEEADEESRADPALADAQHEVFLERRASPAQPRIRMRMNVIDGAEAPEDPEGPDEGAAFAALGPEGPARGGPQLFEQAVAQPVADADRGGDRLETLVTVLADPEVNPPLPGGGYDYEFETIYEGLDEGAKLSMRVTVRDARGEIVGEPLTEEVGVLAYDPPEEDAPVLADPAVAVCALRPDAPAEIEAARAFDACAPGLRPLRYDRLVAFFTPHRDLREPVTEARSFLWRIVDEQGGAVARGSYMPRSGGDPAPSMSSAGPGAPGRFAVELDLWDHESDTDSPVSRYTVETMDARFASSGVLGQGELSLMPAPDAEWVPEGSFEVGDAPVYFQGFVSESVDDLPLGQQGEVWDGRISVSAPRVDGTRVTLDLDGWWQRAVRTGSGMAPFGQVQVAGSRLELVFPDRLWPGHREMGTVEIRATPDREGPGSEGAFFASSVRLPVPTNRPPPDRDLVEGAQIPSPWARGGQGSARAEVTSSGGGFWLWPQGEVPLYDSGQATSGEASITFVRGRREDRPGLPARRLAEHLHDPKTLWVIPVSYTLTDTPYPGRPRLLAATGYGYAIYGPRPELYAGPMPAGAPVAGEPPRAVTDDTTGDGDEVGAGGEAGGEGTETGQAADEESDRSESGDGGEAGAQDNGDTGDRDVPPRPGVVPDVQGWLVDEARAELERAGLSVRLEGLGAPRSADMALRVDTQVPAAGSPRPVDAIVTLRIYGPYSAAIVLPDLVGKPLRDALEWLEDAGLRATVTEAGEAPDPQTAQTVRAHAPRPQASVEPGSTVALSVYGDYVPRTSSLVIVGTDYPPTVQAGDPAADLSVRWTGDPVPPLELVFRARTCPPGFDCSERTVRYESPAASVTATGLVGCTLSGRELWQMDYEVLLRASDGFESAPVPVRVDCVAAPSPPRTTSLRITGTDYQRTIQSGAPSTDLSVDWEGDPVAPLELVFRARTCPAGFECGERTVRADRLTGRLVGQGFVGCSITGTDSWRMDYEVLLRAGDGFESAPVAVPIDCRAEPEPPPPPPPVPPRPVPPPDPDEEGFGSCPRSMPAGATPAFETGPGPIIQHVWNEGAGYYCGYLRGGGSLIQYRWRPRGDGFDLLDALHGYKAVMRMVPSPDPPNPATGWTAAGKVFAVEQDGSLREVGWWFRRPPTRRSP